jgi:hypothetical protein
MSLHSKTTRPSSIAIRASGMWMVAFMMFLLKLSVTPTAAQEYDAFGILKLYDSDPKKAKHDWQNNWWGSERTLLKAGSEDPNDRKTVFKGRAVGGITIGSGEAVHHPGIPRLFINKSEAISSSSSSSSSSSALSPRGSTRGGAAAKTATTSANTTQSRWTPGFENVEFTAYAIWTSDGGETSNAGFTMYGRSDHFKFKEDGCNAVGYYVKIWERGNDRAGRIGFSKEYYHDHETDATVYATVALSRTPSFTKFPKNQWIGIKFVIYTIPGTKNVQLEVYLDRTDGKFGGDWTLAHSHLDEPGTWMAPRGTVQSRCPVQNGDTILGGRYSCALRTDGGEVHWKKATVRHIKPGYLE